MCCLIDKYRIILSMFSQSDMSSFCVGGCNNLKQITLMWSANLLNSLKASIVIFFAQLSPYFILLILYCKRIVNLTESCVEIKVRPFAALIHKKLIDVLSTSISVYSVHLSGFCESVVRVLSTSISFL